MKSFVIFCLDKDCHIEALSDFVPWAIQNHNSKTVCMLNEELYQTQKLIYQGKGAKMYITSTLSDFDTGRLFFGKGISLFLSRHRIMDFNF